MHKGVRVYAVKGNWQLNNSIQSKIVAMAFAMTAEIERDLISQRTFEGNPTEPGMSQIGGKYHMLLSPEIPQFDTLSKQVHILLVSHKAPSGC